MENRYVDVYFKDETHDLHLLAEFVYSIEIVDGFLTIFDTKDNFLHCYNINNISHYHVPNEVFEHSL